jgi:hypothetical protein
MPDPAQAPDPDELLTLPQAARIAGLSRRTLQTAVHMGYLSARKLHPAAREWVVTRGELHRYLMGRRRARPAPLPADYVAPRGTAPMAPECAGAAGDPTLLGTALARWQAAEGLSEVAVAAALGIGVDQLAALAMSRMPNPADPHYAEDLAALATHHGVHAEVLDRVLRAHAGG